MNCAICGYWCRPESMVSLPEHHPECSLANVEYGRVKDWSKVPKFYYRFHHDSVCKFGFIIKVPLPLMIHEAEKHQGMLRKAMLVGQSMLKSSLLSLQVPILPTDLQQVKRSKLCLLQAWDVTTSREMPNGLSQSKEYTIKFSSRSGLEWLTTELIQDVKDGKQIAAQQATLKPNDNFRVLEGKEYPSFSIDYLCNLYDLISGNVEIKTAADAAALYATNVRVDPERTEGDDLLDFFKGRSG